MTFSLIIPVYNGKDILVKCLGRLFDQTYDRSEYEIIVIDDGSADGTDRSFKSMAENAPCEVRYFQQDHKGPAAARNLGITNAKGELILLLGADMMAARTLLEEHVSWHKKYAEGNVAVLGHIAWPPDMKVTPFLEWLEQGPQFGYPKIKDFEDVPYDFFYSSNISLKKRFLLENGLFDEDFPYAAFEDVELGYRLQKKGLRIVYNDKAMAYHEHRIDKKSFGKRSFLAGRSLRIFHQKHPECVPPGCSGALCLLKAVFGIFIWSVPQGIAGAVPKKLLYKGYNCMLEYFMRKGYYSV